MGRKRFDTIRKHILIAIWLSKRLPLLSLPHQFGFFIPVFFDQGTKYLILVLKIAVKLSIFDEWDTIFFITLNEHIFADLRFLRRVNIITVLFIFRNTSHCHAFILLLYICRIFIALFAPNLR